MNGSHVVVLDSVAIVTVEAAAAAIEAAPVLEGRQAPHCAGVYVAVDGNVPMYVGMGASIRTRVLKHLKKPLFAAALWKFLPCQNREQVEAWLIERFQPQWNRRQPMQPIFSGPIHEEIFRRATQIGVCHLADSMGINRGHFTKMLYGSLGFTLSRLALLLPKIGLAIVPTEAEAGHVVITRAEYDSLRHLARKALED